MKKKQFLLLFAFLMILSCERDDICAEGTATTPRLLVEFYDINDPDELKSVLRLTVYGEGLPNPNPPESNVNETLSFDENTTSVELPLLIGAEGEETTVRYIFEKDTNLRLDENVATDSNVDIIEISYSSEFVYVSRACGYKSIFNGLSVIREADTDNWISAIEIEESIETTVENENTVHVRILH
ncbi:DUF6452 family protein [Winogradskyella sp.]|uniref:DUF6452 family protein n=1 Tax=Winogradskyella sp. TaxID=1883156 RepID=UPI0035127322